MVELNPKLKLMSIGIDCKFLKIKDRIRGPVDNILCLNSNYLQSLLDGTYKEKFLKGGLDYEEDKYKIDSLGLLILHNKYDNQYIKNHLKRLENFYNFLSNLKKENYYFLLNIGREDYNLDILEFKKILEKNNLLEKTIVFGNQFYKDEFLNFLPVYVQKNGSTEEFFKSEYSILNYFNNFNINKYDLNFLKNYIY